jgi:hypothetical protein
MSEINVDEVWQQVCSLLTRENVVPAVWQAARLAKPILVDEGVLILGFGPTDQRHGSYLETNVTASVVRKLLNQVTGQDITIRCIEGQDPAAWTRVKEREAASVTRLTGVARERADQRPAQRVWEDVIDRVNQLFRDARVRSTPLPAARALQAALPLIVEAESTARAAAPAAEDVHEREINRVFDRVGTLCGIPPAQIALEYLRLTAK